jgi:organic radical activating enzyme
MNTQIPKKPNIEPNGDLKIHEIFYTIQGEGPLAGTPAVFIRLSDCNLKCPGCDTEYTGGSVMSPREIHDKVNELSPIFHPLVVITGGEPLRQNIDSLCDLLLKFNLVVQIETNGTLPWPTYWEASIRVLMHKDLRIVCSPKTSQVHPDLLPFISAFKYVLEADYVNERGLPTRALMGNQSPWQDFDKLNDEVPIYIQPFDSGSIRINKKHLQATVESSMKFGYKLCLQMHKIAGLA